MTALLIGYAQVSTDAQDLTAQRDGLPALGVDPSRIYVDHGLTGTDRERPGLREARAACREGRQATRSFTATCPRDSAAGSHCRTAANCVC
jgi:DNA invertase Pin-like site-specific DNA recombinase